MDQVDFPSTPYIELESTVHLLRTYCIYSVVDLLDG